MVDLAKITKDDAKDAAVTFLGILAMWTDCLFDGKAGARLLNIDEQSYEGGDINYHSVPPDFLEDYIAKSNLNEADFVKKIQDVFDFAKHGTWNGVDSIHGTPYFDAWLSESVTELQSFRTMFKSKPELYFKDNGLDMLDIPNKNGDLIIDVLLTIIDAVYARWTLEGGGSLTLDQIALLAGVSIKTIRNAVSSKGNDRLLLEGRENDKPVVSANEAYRWLLTKKGFSGPFLYSEEPPFVTYESLSQFRHHCFVLRSLSKLEISDLANKLDWNEQLTEAYAKLENLDRTESLELLTPTVLLAMGQFYQSKSLEIFVIEGSRVLASEVAELRAITVLYS
ncbi:hypothetical protein [Methylobacter psychrophilus]|uniref:hypothetical protein n=1 Tax=Methylobacter psychrophilus TaxID=96941 RepID=UPI0021D4D0A8|nr:hypothetical protein [Methylobacter psychrophilus]